MIQVTCAIILKEDKVLVTQRSEHMTHPLKWEFPGGKIHKEESEEDCIKREIREELNIDIQILSKLSSQKFDFGDIQINLIPFVAGYLDGDIQLLEHKDYKWLNRKDLESVDWVPADVLVLKEFLNL